MKNTLPALVILCAPALLIAQPAGSSALDSCSETAQAGPFVTLACREGVAVRLQPVDPGILRVRVSTSGRFPESLTEHWGFVRSDWPAVAFRKHSTNEAVRMETAELHILVSFRPFRISIADRAGRTFFEETSPARDSANGGTRQRISMAADEHFYGLGFQRKAFDMRGSKLAWWRAFRSSEATVPFFLSSRGYAYYSNNTYRHTFDFTGSGSYTVSADGGDLDYYVVHGPRYRRMLERYTALTGRPLLAPRWALGIGYEARYLEEQTGIEKIASRFRGEDIPIDWIGLEPGWEQVPYDMKWRWSPARFPDPDSMIRRLAAMGIKMGLWESGAAPKTGYTDEQVRLRWYRPRIEAAIRKGIKFFKQDDPYPRMISSQEMLEPELNRALGGSGVFTAAEMNNVTNSLYSETAMREYTRVTGERAMIMFNGYGSSIASHRWPFTWEADFPLGTGALSASLSAHSLVSTRDRNEAPDGIHLGYLAPFSYLESWAYYKEPWLYSGPLLDMNRFYVKLRYRLIPYLYSSLRQAATSGLPLMRPMPLDFQDDPATAALASQFMLGDALLVSSGRATITSGAELPGGMKREEAAGTKPRVYLPKGRWYDYWSGDAVDSRGEWRDASWPSYAGGPLWVRGGSIIPMGPVIAWSDQEPLDVVELDIYPAGASRYSLYEDDGRTYAYRKGAFTATELRCREHPGGLTIHIGARQGSYQGMPERRAFLLGIHTRLAPVEIVAAGKRLAPALSKEDLVLVAARRGWYHDAARGVLWIKPSTGWRYGYDARGAKADPDRDTVYWAPGAPGQTGAMAISVTLVKPAPKIPGPGPAAILTMESGHHTLIADGTSTTPVTITVRDASYRQVHNARAAVHLEAGGGALLGCGLAACELETVDGIARTVLTAPRAAGPVLLRAVSAGPRPAELTVNVVRGVIYLQASPPERIKLNSDGSWLPLRVNLYATIQAGGETIRSANTRLHLHITGGSGRVPPDAEVQAVEGVGVFENVVFDKPPNYVMHVGGPGLEPASIPIY